MYLEPQDHISKGKKKDWQIGNLGRSVEEAFGANSSVVEVAMHDPETEEHIHSFYYVPVSDKLQNMAGQLGAYLHGQRNYREDGDDWWTEMRNYLEEVYSELETTNRGNLVGAPLRDRGTNRVRMISGEIGEEAMKRMRPGMKLQACVRHLDKLPE